MIDLVLAVITYVAAGLFMVWFCTYALGVERPHPLTFFIFTTLIWPWTWIVIVQNIVGAWLDRIERRMNQRGGATADLLLVLVVAILLGTLVAYIYDTRRQVAIDNDRIDYLCTELGEAGTHIDCSEAQR